MKRTKLNAGILLLALVMLIGMMPLFGTTVSAEGPELIDGYYQIATEADLAWFRDTMNAEGSETNPLKAKLTADIALAEKWEPITDLYGELDGDGHKIDNVAVDITGAYMGFINNNYGVFKNVELAGAYETQVTSRRHNGLGTVGRNYATVSGIRSAINFGSEKQAGDFGGIVGQNTGGLVENCLYSGTMTVADGFYAGGIVGCNRSGDVIANVFEGTVINGRKWGQTGGIIGKAELVSEPPTSNIVNNISRGTLSNEAGESAQTGGVIGFTSIMSNYDQAGYAINTLNNIHVGEIIVPAESKHDGILAAMGNSNYYLQHFFFENNYQAVAADETLQPASDYYFYNPELTRLEPEQMKAPEFVGTLNGFDAAAYNVTLRDDQKYIENAGGYPMLAWEKTGVSGTLTVTGARVLEDPDTTPEEPLYHYWEKDVPFEVEPGTTAMGVLEQTLTALGYTVNIVNGDWGPYLVSITNPDGVELIGGETNGKLSGWMWCYNGEVAMSGADAVVVNDGDDIRFYYTNNYRNTAYIGIPEDYAPMNGWVTEWDGKKYYYVDDEAVTGLYEIDGAWYFFDDKGVMQTGLQTIDGGIYYFDETGKRQTGWLVIDGNKMFFDLNENGKAATGVYTVGNKILFFDENGVQQTGWQVIDGNTMYFDPDNAGEAARDLTRIDGDIYYFDGFGHQQTGWQVIGGNVMYFDAENNGKAAIGLTTINNTVYLFDKNGVRMTGWHVLDGKAMYFNKANGGRLTGLRKIGKTTYLLSEDGKQTGWHVVGGKQLYFDPMTGGLLTGKRTVGNTTYLLTKNGKLTGWHILSGGKYYFDPNFGGGMITGLRKVGTGTYFFRTEDGGTKATQRGSAILDGSIVLNGKTYTFNEKGVLIP